MIKVQGNKVDAIEYYLKRIMEINLEIIKEMEDKK
jgi:hypothetical protein